MFFELGETFSHFEVGFGRSVSSLCVTQWLLAGSGHLIGHATWFGVFWILGMDLDGSNAKMGMGDTGFLALSLCVWQTFNEEFSLGSRCSLGLCDEIRHSYRFRRYRFPHLLQKHVQRDSVLLWFVSSDKFLMFLHSRFMSRPCRPWSLGESCTDAQLIVNLIRLFLRCKLHEHHCKLQDSQGLQWTRPWC